MKHYLKRGIMKKWLILFAVCIMPACAPIYDTSYEIIPPRSHSGKLCANNCILAKQSCNHACSAEASICESIRSLEAQNQYLEYVNERQLNRQPVLKTRSAFTGKRYCSSSNCEARCQDDYHQCHTNCGGQVIESKVCIAFCK